MLYLQLFTGLKSYQLLFGWAALTSFGLDAQSNKGEPAHTCPACLLRIDANVSNQIAYGHAETKSYDQMRIYRTVANASKNKQHGFR